MENLKEREKCIDLCKSASTDMSPVFNATWANFGAPSGIGGEVGNLTGSDVDDLVWSGDGSWNVTQMNSSIGGDIDLRGGGDGYWWEEKGEGDDFPVVKFGPDLTFLEPLGVYINLALLVVAIVLTIGVVCRCVAGKVRVTLDRRRGAEIALQLGSTGDVVERVVVTEAVGRRENGVGDRPGNTRGFAI